MAPPLDTTISLSSAYHPQSDGQTERTNQMLEQYIRLFTASTEDAWVDLLPFAEFAYNNTTHASTGTTPFVALYGRHPRMDLLDVAVPTACPAADVQLDRLRDIHALVRQNLEDAAESMKRFADAHRDEGPALNVGDMVWLSTQNLRTKTKFSARKIGPFAITAKINDVAFRLALGPEFKIHNVFHRALLTKATDYPFPHKDAARHVRTRSKQ